MDLENFTDDQVRQYARRLYQAAEGLGTDEDAFYRVRDMIERMDPQEAQDLVNRIDDEILSLSNGAEGLRDLIIGDFSTVEETDLLKDFGFPTDSTPSLDWANKNTEGSLRSDFSQFGNKGAMYNQRSPDPAWEELKEAFNIQGAPTEVPGQAPEVAPEAAPTAPEAAPQMPDEASQANQPPTNFSNPVTTSAEPAEPVKPKFTNSPIQMPKIPEDDVAASRMARNASYNLNLLGPEAALKQKMLDAQLDRDLPIVDVPSLPKDHNLTDQGLTNFEGKVRDARAANLDSQRGREKREKIFKGNDFDDFATKLAESGIDTDPRAMDFNTLSRLYDRYRYNRPRQQIPSTNRQIGMRIQDRNSTMQQGDDMFTAYAGPSTGGELKMVRVSEANRLNDLDNARKAAEAPGMTEEEGLEFWNSDQWKDKKNWF